VDAADERLVQAVAFERILRMRAAQRVIDVRGGVAVLHDDLSRLHHLNALLFDAPLGDGGEAIRELADRHLGHLPHRHVVLDDGPAAERLAPDFESAGWTVERIVYMALGSEPDRPPRGGVAVELPCERLRDLERQIDEEEELARGWPPGAAEVVSAGMDVLRTGTAARSFAAGENGQLAAMCTLFVDDGVAMLDNVGTLVAYRRRGLARAAISAAVSAAQASGCREILVSADADDWPRQLYARMGFTPLGTQVAFTLWAVGSAR
jgi:GNAT superfamily N-acetyltransferase